MISKYLGVGSFALILCSEVFGGPTPPQQKPQLTELTSVLKESHLDEVSPLIDNITFQKSPTTIEVFIEAWAYTDCYDKREAIVELKASYTQIVPRISRRKATQACSLKLRKYTEKIAELDAADPASKEVRVLGFRGWHTRRTDTPEEAIPNSK